MSTKYYLYDDVEVDETLPEADVQALMDMKQAIWKESIKRRMTEAEREAVKEAYMKMKRSLMETNEVPWEPDPTRAIGGIRCTDEQLIASVKQDLAKVDKQALVASMDVCADVISELDPAAGKLYRVLFEGFFEFIQGEQISEERALELQELCQYMLVQFQDYSGEQSLIKVLTNGLSGHLHSFITSRKENSVEEFSTRKNGRPELIQARSWLNLPRGTERPDATELLERMHKKLLRHKEEDASLLKTHLYLVDRAYKKGGDSPTFTVIMDELLEAKGYTRRADGSFHPDTYRQEWGRIATLAGCWLELRRVQEKNRRGKVETFIDETPYWEVRARRRLEEGEALGLETVLLEDPNAPIIKAVVMQPGLWWAFSERGTMNFHLPREILAIPTDGNGNEAGRMAVKIAATLALWVRSSQQQHAGKECVYSVGALLEASGIKTREEFEEESAKGAKRLREYLLGTPDEPGGALQHLTNSEAFNVYIRDENEFWASGRGWRAHFWEAKLAVQIPDLGIKKVEKSQHKKRKRVRN